MLECTYDPKLPYRFVKYLRMSDRSQNPRSPDQQAVTIDETIARLAYPWTCVTVYRDDAITGRYIHKRPGFNRMLRDIEARLVVIDLIVVDSLERLGRADEIAELRRRLVVEHGVLVVAADNQFSDPTGIVGKAVGMVEQIRSTENTRITRHNVIRGKKDAARQGRWPGGPPPFGFRLKPIVDPASSPPQAYNVLEPNLQQAAALRLAFQRADMTGEGDVRLAQWWNTSSEIAEDLKPVSPFTIGYRLENPIAIGTLRWGAHRTAIVNDTRVVRRNRDGAEVIARFCPAIIDADLYDRVQRLRKLRAAKIQESRHKDPAHETKHIAPQAPGLTLKYVLSGLVRCGHCKASLRPVPSGRRSKAGRRYIYYVCPRHYDGACSNAHHVPENRLRKAVVSKLRAVLFPLTETTGTPEWLPMLLGLVRREMQIATAQEPDRAAVRGEAIRNLEHQLNGWLVSLGNPQLPALVRSDVERRYEDGRNRLEAFQRTLKSDVAASTSSRDAVPAVAVLDALRLLDEVLGQHNPTLVNLELAKHIGAIVVCDDGRVEMHGTGLGLFHGETHVLGEGRDHSENEGDRRRFSPVIPRRRGKLRVPSLLTSRVGNDPHRIPGSHTADGMPDGDTAGALAWEDSIDLASASCWSKSNANEVARMRAAGKTHQELAAHFGVSIPTIRKALRLAVAANASLSLPQKMPRACWAVDHAAEVLQLKASGLSITAIARRLGKSEPTIRAALEHAQRARNGDP